MIKTSGYQGLVFGSFLASEMGIIFGHGCGASLVWALYGEERL